MKTIMMVTGIVIFFLVLACGISFAELTNLDLPDREDIKYRDTVQGGGSSAGLTNLDLPSRDGIKYHDIVLHGAFRMQEMYDSNVFLNNTDRRVDGINVISPSGGIEIPFGNNMSSFDYQTDIYLYDHYHHENHVDSLLRGLIELNLAEFKVTISDVFNVFTNRAANEDSARIRQVNNDGRIGVSSQHELLGYDIGYTNRLETYSSNDLEFGPITYEDRNRDSHIIDGTLTYRFMPKTLFLVENDLGFVRYINSAMVPDSWYDEILLGIKGEWFSKMNLNFKAGFRSQFYDNSDIVADKSYIGAIIRGGLDYHPTDNDTVKIDLYRAPYESTYSNMNYYTSNVAAFAYRHNFNDKIYGTIFGSYQLHEYPSESTENGLTAKRYDNYLTGGTSVRYDIRKWVSVEARYDYTWKSSKFDIFDYVDHMVTLRGTVGF